MQLLDRQSDASPEPRGGASRPAAGANRPSTSGNRVHLRMRADGQLVELAQGKTTIGSSPRCNVRIQRAGVQPLHCLIVQGPEGLKVRSWASNTKLNGTPFVESSLALGDCLSLGSVELDVVDPEARKPVVETRETSLPEAQDDSRIRESRDLARTRGRQLLATLRRERSALQELQKQVSDLQEEVLQTFEEGSDVSGRLEGVKAELAAARQQLNAQQHIATAHDELVERNEQLRAESGELSKRLDQSASAQARTAKELQTLVDAYASLDEQFEQLIDENSLLQNDIGQIAGEKAAAEEQIRQLVAVQSQFDSELNRIAMEKSATDEQNRQLCDEKYSLENSVRQIADEKAASDEHIRQLVDEQSQLRAEVGRLADEVVAGDEQNQHLVEEVARFEKEVNRLANEKAASDERKEQMVGELFRLESELGHIANEKNAIHEQHQQLIAEKSQLHIEFGQITNERESLCVELADLRRHTEQLAAEKAALTDEHSAVVRERDELGERIEELKARIAQLCEENSAMAVGKLTVVEQHNALGKQAAELQARIDELSNENAELLAAKSALGEEQTRLLNENKRLADLEREMGAAVKGRESTSEELYRALLQLSELQERDDRSKEVLAAFESLSSERDQLARDAAQLKEQFDRQSEERAAVEAAWQALSAEAAALSESQQHLAEDNSALLERLEEAKQQLENVEQERAIAARVAAKLEEERAAKTQAEAATVEAATEAERKLAEQARQFAETINKLEEQLAATNEVQKTWERAREEWQAQMAAAGANTAEQSRRILQLESQVAAADALAAELRDRAAQVEAAHRSALQAALAAKPVESFSEAVNSPTNESRAEFNWSSGGESLSQNVRDMSGESETAAHFSNDWGGLSGQSHACDATVDSWNQSAAAQEESKNPFANTAGFGDATDESAPWGGETAAPAAFGSGAFGDVEAQPAAELERSIWPAAQEAGLQREEGEAVAPATEFANLNQAPEQATAGLRNSAVAAPSELFARQSAAESGAEKKSEPTSYIERFSHMFAEEGTPREAAVAPVAKPARSSDLAASQARDMGIVRPSGGEPGAARSDDEESIEQYMAKLLQRVRGDSSGATFIPASQAPLKSPAMVNPAGPQTHSSPLALAENSPIVSSEAGPSDSPAPLPVSREPVKRRAPSTAPATDLGALRALANETARRAISRHELRKHRRNMVTKVIVSTLAGVTSLWLMLDSPTWWNIQFITACVTLIVAAYWAGETCRTLMESFRAVYDGPGAGLDESDPIADPALPIDVEERQ